MYIVKAIRLFKTESSVTVISAYRDINSEGDQENNNLMEKCSLSYNCYIMVMINNCKSFCITLTPPLITCNL